MAKMSKKSVSDDLATTFSSPAAWFLVVALIVTWSAVAIVMFDLMDYKSLVGGFKDLSSDPMKVIDEAVEDTSNWIYGFISLLSDILSTKEYPDDDMDEGEIEPQTKKKGVHHPPAKQKGETRPPSKRKAPPLESKRMKPEKKIKVKEEVKQKAPTKVDKKIKVPKVEEKVKKQLKVTKLEKKVEKVKKPERKPQEEDKVKTKIQVKKEREKLKIETEQRAKKRDRKEPSERKSEKASKKEVKVKDTKEVKQKSKDKDQYQFCRYVIDMYTLGNIYPGHLAAPAVTPAPELVKPPAKKLPTRKPTGTSHQEEKDAVTATKHKEIKKPEMASKLKAASPSPTIKQESVKAKPITPPKETAKKKLSPPAIKETKGLTNVYTCTDIRVIYLKE
ncbi:triadin [Pristis pectinata]|uniref:triadin n=1 Tax=Pristis pectinata TaxID=685728 RepID=UPI00223E6191|nr:triadin [Pristis pectinata]